MKGTKEMKKSNLEGSKLEGISGDFPGTRKGKSNNPLDWQDSIHQEFVE